MKSFFNSIILVIIIFFNFGNLAAANILTLEEAVNIALQNNYSIKIAKSEEQIEANNYHIGNSGFLPSVDVEGRVNKAIQNVNQEYLDGRQVNRDNAQSSLYEGTIGLNWTIFDGFRMFADYSRFGELKEIGKLRLKSQIENTTRDVINKYLSILHQKLALEVASDNLKISRGRYQFINDRFEVGTASKIDLLQAGVDLNADISDSIDQHIAYDNLKIELNNLLNQDINTDFEVSGNIDINSNLNKSELNKTEANTDIQIAKKIVEVNNYNLDAVRSEFFPILSAYGIYNYTRQESESGFLKRNTANGINYGLNLSLNLFNGFNTSIASQNAEINKQIAHYMLSDLTNSIQSSISIALNGYTKFKELSRFENENVNSARENMELALESLNLGLMSSLEFRETQRQLSNAKLRYITSLYNAKINETELLRLTGSLIK